MHPSRLVASALLLVACNKPDAAGTGGKGGGGGDTATPAASGPQSAAGGATPGATRITECPKSLGGPESKIDRVISKDCGPVVVTEQYSIDGGSLTLEAGATLQFKDGAALVVGYYEPAKLLIQGTPEAPVTLTSAGDKAAGVWRGVELWKAARSSLAGAVIEYAGDDDRAVFVAATDVSITNTTIRETKGTALKLDAQGSLAAFTGNSLSKLGAKAAIVAPPSAIVGIAAGNKFDGGAYVVVQGGTLGKSATWANPGVPLQFPQQVSVDAEGEGGERAVLTLSPGTELRFGPDGRLTIGYYRTAGLVAKGTADAAITFTSADAREAGAWLGVQVFSHGEATVEHATFEFGGKDGEPGVLMVESGALSLRETTFRSNRAGVAVRGEAKIKALADNKFAATPAALAVPAALVGALGEGNAFDSDARILVEPGNVTAAATWLAQGAPLELLGEIGVDADLTLDAGLKLLARPEAKLVIGFYQPAKLLAKGTAAAPITLGATAGTWRGVNLHVKSSGSALEYVQLSETGEDPAVWIEGEVEAKLDNVSCAKCKAAVVGWSCGAKVSRASVLASDGTPAIEKAPEGC